MCNFYTSKTNFLKKMLHEAEKIFVVAKGVQPAVIELGKRFRPWCATCRFGFVLR